MADWRRRGSGRGSSVSITNSHAVNVIAESSGARQEVVQTRSAQNYEQILTFTTKLRTALPSNPIAAEIADDIDEAARRGDRGALRAALSKAEVAVAGALGTEVGKELLDMLKPLLRAVGL